MLCREGKISLISFTISALTSISLSSLVLYLYSLELNNLSNSFYTFIGPIIFYVIHYIFGLIVLPKDESEIVKRAALLGLFFGSSTTAVIFAPLRWKCFGVYFIFMSIFHYSEYLTIAWVNPRTLSASTFMLTHSLAYIIAAASSWIEFCLEIYFWPQIKESIYPILIGIVICIGGEILRKLAIITANTNFNHLVQFRKVEGHTLVTHGVYHFMRHPSYAGWFFWSIGTQIILSNPICSILYAIVSWKFFHERILVEEVTLMNFFGQKYIEYQDRTPSGVPFVRGYVEGAYDENSFK